MGHYLSPFDITIAAEQLADYLSQNSEKKKEKQTITQD